MTTKDAIGYVLNSNSWVLHHYLSDLSDADLLVRPAPGANHAAWQLGHLIAAEVNVFLSKVPGANMPILPDGFAKQHAKENSGNDSPAGFLTKDEYLALRRTVRGATLAALEAIPEADLDKPSNWNDMAPTVGTLFLVVGNHDLMHAGQFTVLRRKLGKPVLF